MSGLWMGVRFAALMIAQGGSVDKEDLRRLARSAGVTGRLAHPSGHGSRGSKINDVVRKRMNELINEGLVVRTGDHYRAVDLAELAAFVADELDDLDAEEAGGVPAVHAVGSAEVA